jgi:hypothetical protein
MDWQSQLNGDPLPWLIEKTDPGVRYLALRDLVGLHDGDLELVEAQKAAHTQGPIAIILNQMHPDGYWSRPGAGYNPKYYSAVWSLIMLAQLGASIRMDARITHACDYLMEASLNPNGQFSVNGAPSGTIDCLQGNLCASLMALGYDDPRLVTAYEWMARTVTGEGMAPTTEPNAPLRYFAYKCGPLFACGPNNKSSCAWGAIKVMLAFSRWPKERRTPLILRAIQQGVDFLFSRDPALADYPTGTESKPSSNWWKFGFPVFYISDILQIVEALTGLGLSHDPRLANAIRIIHDKQDEHGRWSLEYDYTGKTWVDFGQKKQPNKWVTLRALNVLKGI